MSLNSIHSLSIQYEQKAPKSLSSADGKLINKKQNIPQLHNSFKRASKHNTKKIMALTRKDP